MSDDDRDLPVPLSLEFLHDLLGFNLRLAYAAANRDFSVLLAELNLTQRQCTALQLIGANAGVSQIDVASTLGIDRSSMMAIAAELETKKLIVRRKSKADARRHELHLTARGKSILTEVRALMLQHDKHLADGLSKRELTTLIENLRRMHQRF